MGPAETLIVLLLFAVVLIAVAVVVIVVRRGPKPSSGDAAAVGLLQQQLDALRAQVAESQNATSQNMNQQIASMNQNLNQQLAATGQQFSQGVLKMAENLDRRLGDVTAQVNLRLKENLDVLHKSGETVGARLDVAAQIMSQVETRMVRMEEAGRRIYDVGKDIAGLQEILRAPKLRGVLGEFLLEELLKQILPPQYYVMQYGFRSGEKVDAALRLGNGIVPVDSKFPLENFRKFMQAESDEDRAAARRVFVADVRKHIDSIAGKYILPDEGTFDFALMYIPAENVYYETIIKDESFGDERSISAYALSKRIIPVSPNSFYAYLQAIVLGLRGLRIEESAREILQSLKHLQGELGKFHEDFGKIGTHLKNAQGAFAAAEKHLMVMETKLDQIESREPAGELPLADPQ